MGLLDIAALIVFFASAGLWALRQVISQTPRNIFLIVLVLLSALYITIRVLHWVRERLLWSLRNRLVITYLFIAVVPVLLLLAMAGLAAYLLYWQLGSYVLYTQMQDRVNRLRGVTATLVTSYAVEAVSGSKVAALAIPIDVNTYLKNAMTDLPGLKIETGKGEDLLQESKGPLKDRYSGLVVNDGVLNLRSVIVRQTPSGPVVVSGIVPVTPELLETLGPELGPVRLEVLRPESVRSTHEVSVVSDRRGYSDVQEIATSQRSIPQADNPFDKLITGIVALEVLDQDRKVPDQYPTRLIASFTTRPSLLNRRLFSPLGDLGGAAATALLVVGAVFLVIEFGSLLTGIVLTRTITTAVDDLYQATQHVQAGDLTFRVRVPHRDQLAALGESFNSMMHSVSMLIDEQRKRQRLENELSIAQEVQQQLFPHALPQLPGVELEAICRPARVVSGDYYDFIRVTPTILAIALADISGKGISAALLMASVQAALRSDVLRYREGQPGYGPSEIDTAKIASHLNRHLFRNTSEERYATFFFAVYDTESRRLNYTNAGHPPPIYIGGDCVQQLETGGTVVGLFNDVPYEQGSIEIQPGGMLIAYSDGLSESENIHGEEFGSERLIETIELHREESSHLIADAMMRAAEGWSGSSEQADDMTVVVARFSSAQGLNA
jgi:sigma-B regulation protein RsbU (phosphoserine phosphatase)